MGELLQTIWLAWWFSLPAYIANIMPGIARVLPGGTVPVSRHYLGPNKTIAAIPAALVGAGSIVYLQLQLSYPDWHPQASWYALTLCFGLGTPLGDWAKSLMKRIMGIKPGGKWWYEKIDFLVMSLLFLTISGTLTPRADFWYYLVPILFMLGIHGPGNKFAYKRGWRKTPH